MPIALATQALRFAYADPPYPGTAARYYKAEESYAGEVDHPALIARLEARRASGELAGWALSTSAKAGLPIVMPLLPPAARVCPWCKHGAVPASTFGSHNSWEPLIVVGGRALRPGFADFLTAHSARRGGTLPGRKPIAFWAFLFRQLGMLPGDTFEDLFPGTGTGSAAWAEINRTTGA